MEQRVATWLLGRIEPGIGARLLAARVEAGIEQVFGEDVPHRREQRVANARMLSLEIVEQALDPPAHQVVLRAAEIAGDDGEGQKPRELCDVRLGGIAERTDDHVPSVVADEARRHRTHLSREEHGEEQRLDEIVAVVPERDLGAAHLPRRGIEDPPAQPRAHGAERLSRWSQPQDLRIGVLAEHPYLDALLAQVRLEPRGGKAGVALVEVAGDEVEADGCPLLQLLQEVEQRERVLAARDGDEDPIALLHEAEVLDGAAHVVEQPFLEAGVGLSHGGALVTPSLVARLNLRLPENAPGSLFVDSTCIDCDACRQIAPTTFARSDRSGLSYVQRQPAPAQRKDALVALVACPTASIGGAQGREVREAFASLPLHVDGPVHDLGLRAESSFGATSYLVVREGGNVIVDSPRAANPLLDRIEGMGGARWNFLTHRDDVADHEALHERFGCERVLHRADVSGRTRAVERQIEGKDPVELAPGLVVIPVPGHTRGSAAFLVDDTYLFTGDHLWAEDDGSLGMSRSVCWYSWEEQVRSLKRLLDFRFRFVLPGHGRRAEARDTGEMRGWIQKLVREVE